MGYNDFVHFLISTQSMGMQLLTRLLTTDQVADAVDKAVADAIVDAIVDAVADALDGAVDVPTGNDCPTVRSSFVCLASKSKNELPSRSKIASSLPRTFSSSPKCDQTRNQTGL